MHFIQISNTFLTRFTVVCIFVFFSPIPGRTDCTCQTGSNGIYVVGYEFLAKNCPPEPHSDNTQYVYLVNPINCMGGIVKSSTYGDISGSPAGLISFYTGKGYQIVRNPSGTHMIAVQNGTYPFTGVIAGISVAGTTAGVYQTAPPENFDEYCTASPLPDLNDDGVPDCIADQCPDDPDKTAPGLCGCGVPDTDSDGDGTVDCNDQCPDDPYKTDPDLCGCNVPDADSDGDELLDCYDNNNSGPPRCE